MSDSEDEEFGFFLDVEDYNDVATPDNKPPRIYPRTPAPRQRKVSVYDLVTALEHALEVTTRRNRRALDNVVIQKEISVPQTGIDVSKVMNNLLKKISHHFSSEDRLYFHDLVVGADKQSVVLTFIPLLHLTNERRVDLEQKEHFREIAIRLIDDSPVTYTG